MKENTKPTQHSLWCIYHCLHESRPHSISENHGTTSPVKVQCKTVSLTSEPQIPSDMKVLQRYEATNNRTSLLPFPNLGTSGC